MGQTAFDEDDAVDQADDEAGRQRRHDGQAGRAMVPPDDRAHHRAQRQVGADRQIDASREDDEQLTDRQYTDDGRLLEDVPDVLERQEHV
jgi:hypothetical protein